MLCTRRVWYPAKILAAIELAGAGFATIALILLLSASPPFECGPEYASPTTPLRGRGWAGASLGVAIIGLFVGIGMTLAAPRDSESRLWGKRAIGAAFLATLLAGGAVFADLARWTCWP